MARVDTKPQGRRGHKKAVRRTQRLKTAGTAFHLVGVGTVGLGLLGAGMFVAASSGPLGWAFGAAIGLGSLIAGYYAFREGKRVRVPDGQSESVEVAADGAGESAHRTTD